MSRDRSRSRDRDSECNDDSGGHHREGRNFVDKTNDVEEPQEEAGSTTHNLYITNLSFQTTDESITEAFSKFGKVTNASIIKEPLTGSSRGFGFVAFASKEMCERAIDAMNGGPLDGRSIKVDFAKRNTAYNKTPGQYLGPAQLSSRYTNGQPKR